MSECVICGRPMADQAYACPNEAAQAAQKLREVAETTPEARAVAYGQTRGAHGASASKPGSRSPGNDDALDALGEIQGMLTTWARHVAEERGLGIPLAAEGEDQLLRSTEWLEDHVGWLRHRPEVDEVYRDFAEAASKLRWIVDGSSAKKYLGPCGAILECNPIRCAPDCPPGCGVTEPVCEGDVYGRAGGDKGTCRTCKTEYDQAERQIWLTQQVRSSDLAWTARGIADALGINVKTVRAWATDRWSGDVLIRRAKLSTYWRDEQGRLVPWSEVARGERLHYVGDVKALAEQAADRRAAREAAERGELAA